MTNQFPKKRRKRGEREGKAVFMMFMKTLVNRVSLISLNWLCQGKSLYLKCWSCTFHVGEQDSIFVIGNESDQKFDMTHPCIELAFTEDSSHHRHSVELHSWTMLHSWLFSSIMQLINWDKRDWSSATILNIVHGLSSFSSLSRYRYMLDQFQYGGCHSVIHSHIKLVIDFLRAFVHDETSQMANVSNTAASVN